MTFEGPQGAAFPRDQPSMPSYVIGQNDLSTKSKKNIANDDSEEKFTEEEIRKSFEYFDLDKNGEECIYHQICCFPNRHRLSHRQWFWWWGIGYIGAAEIRHILIFMGEHVSDEEVDMMISMLDLNGDGQISFKEFKAMVESDDPANENFLEGGLPARSSDSVASRRSIIDTKRAEKKIQIFSRCIQTAKLENEDVTRMWGILRKRAHSSSKKVGRENFMLDFDGFSELMPVFSTTSEAHSIFDLLRESSQSQVDGRELIMCFSNFVDFRSEEKCQLAFDMYDVDRSGFLSLDEIEALLMSTNLQTREAVKKRASTVMRCADVDGSGGVTIDELIVAAEKFPNLIFPLLRNILKGGGK